MITNWNGYEEFRLGVEGRLQELPRSDARLAYKRAMGAKSDRIAMLGQLVKAHGIDLDTSLGAVQSLNDWFRLNVQPDLSQPGYLLAVWSSVAFDIGMYLGEVAISRHPQLHWEFYAGGKKNVSYQRPVIMGYTATINPRYNIDFWDQVRAYGHSVVRANGAPTAEGVVTVRGVVLDVDEILASRPRTAPRTDAFCNWILSTDSNA